MASESKATSLWICFQQITLFVPLLYMLHIFISQNQLNGWHVPYTLWKYLPSFLIKIILFEVKKFHSLFLKSTALDVRKILAFKACPNCTTDTQEGHWQLTVCTELSPEELMRPLGKNSTILKNKTPFPLPTTRTCYLETTNFKTHWSSWTTNHRFTSSSFSQYSPQRGSWSINSLTCSFQSTKPQLDVT